MATKVFCDRCKLEIVDHKQHRFVELNKFDDVKMGSGFELCEDCFVALNTFVADFKK